MDMVFFLSCELPMTACLHESEHVYSQLNASTTEQEYSICYSCLYLFLFRIHYAYIMNNVCVFGNNANNIRLSSLLFSDLGIFWFADIHGRPTAGQLKGLDVSRWA